MIVISVSLLCQVGDDLQNLWGISDMRPKNHSFTESMSHAILTPLFIRSAFFLRQTHVLAIWNSQGVIKGWTSPN